MKKLMIVFALGLAASAGAVPTHRSFRNGYPTGAQGATVRQPVNPAVLKSQATPRSGGTKVVTNRVVLTKEQAEKLKKSKKGQKVKKNKVEKLKS